MFQVHYLNPISAKGTDLWTENYQTAENVNDADAVVVRSAAMHDMEFSKNLLAVARAGAGVNNIPLDRCADWKTDPAPMDEVRRVYRPAERCHAATASGYPRNSCICRRGTGT